MDTNRLTRSLSRRVLIQFVLSLIVLLVLLAANAEFLIHFYFENQQTNTGIIINSTILGLFVLGMLSIVMGLLRYLKEENSIIGFVHNLEQLRDDPTQELDPDSLIVRRYNTLKMIQSSGGEIDHNALAAMMTADESTRVSLPRFVNNVIILTGVFGTIVSLSIALIGASDLLESSAASLGGMGLVIHGMSTALSTTITAIVSYMFFGYFYLRLTDVQTHMISGIEQITTVHLLPKFQVKAEGVVNQMGGVIKALIRATEQMTQTQASYQESADRLLQIFSQYEQNSGTIGKDLKTIEGILRDGFRLPGDR